MQRILSWGKVTSISETNLDKCAERFALEQKGLKSFNAVGDLVIEFFGDVPEIGKSTERAVQLEILRKDALEIFESSACIPTSVCKAVAIIHLAESADQPALGFNMVKRQTGICQQIHLGKWPKLAFQLNTSAALIWSQTKEVDLIADERHHTSSQVLSLLNSENILVLAKDQGNATSVAGFIETALKPFDQEELSLAPVLVHCNSAIENWIKKHHEGVQTIQPEPRFHAWMALEEILAKLFFALNLANNATKKDSRTKKLKAKVETKLDFWIKMAHTLSHAHVNLEVEQPQKKEHGMTSPPSGKAARMGRFPFEPEMGKGGHWVDRLERRI